MDNLYLNFDWEGTTKDVLKTGGDIFASTQNRKAQEAQAKALREQGYTQLEIAKIQQQTKLAELEALKAGGGTKAGSTVLYVALGVGAVIILGVVIFAVTRKK
jgi:hypothetical protein